MAATTTLSTSQNNSTSFPDAENGDKIPLESIPLYIAANYLMNICSPLVVLLGTFGNTMIIIIMHRMRSEHSAIDHYFTGMAAMDLGFLYSATFTEWLYIAFGYQLKDTHRVVCKLVMWFQTGSGTISCWYLVCLTVHRAMSVVWPHRVSLLCTRRTVLSLITGIALFFAALYAHYLFGFDLLHSGGGTNRQCLMDSEDYIHFVFNVFVYMEMSIYCLFPFACLVLGNTILVWKLSDSLKEARNRLSQGNTAQMLTREKTANSVTLTVILVSVTFVVLSFPVSFEYITTYFGRKYRPVSGYEHAKAHMFYVISRLLAYSNSAVNFYLYCLTGNRFREEFLKLICHGRVRGQTRASKVVEGA